MPRLLLYRQLITLLWLAWALYWIVSAANSKTTRRRESLGSRLAHILPLVLGGVLLAGNALPWRGLHDRLWPRSLAAYWIGVVLLPPGSPSRCGRACTSAGTGAARSRSKKATS